MKMDLEPRRQEDAPQFDEQFRRQLETLFAWRRDVRRFSIEPVPQQLLDMMLDHAQLSPSVGNSQPWRWVQVSSPGKRAEIRANFTACNAAAQAAQSEARAAAYTSLKLEGMDRAPLQFAVFCDRTTPQGHGLGRHSMQETLEYSTVAMITTFWLSARAAGLGVGWVSILDSKRLSETLGAPETWKFIAYLCVGWPDEEHPDPELVRFGWQQRTGTGREVKIV